MGPGRGVGDAQSLAHDPDGVDTPADPCGHYVVGVLPQQAQLRLGPPRPVVAGLQVAAQAQLPGAPAALVALLVSQPALAHGGGALLGGCLDEPLAALVVGPGDAQGLTPAPHHAFADAPPVHDG